MERSREVGRQRKTVKTREAAEERQKRREDWKYKGQRQRKRGRKEEKGKQTVRKGQEDGNRYWERERKDTRYTQWVRLDEDHCGHDGKSSALHHESV